MKQAFAIVVLAAILAVVVVKFGFFSGGPSIAKVDPDHAAPGQSVTILGGGLDADPASFIVFFNDVTTPPEGVVPGGIKIGRASCRERV